MKLLVDTTLVLALLTSSFGCGGGTTLQENKRQSAAQAYEKADQAFKAQNFSEAKVAYDECLNGGLPADLVGPARVRRAICLAESGDSTAANEEIKALEAAAPNLDEVFAAKSYILAKQGKTAESQAAWAQAVRYNRSVQKFGN
jgi:tetratricopeptide (TPR) repeat protein